MKSYYKIVDEDKPNLFKTLFHGTNKSRILLFNKWLKAEIKDVTDGSCQKPYKSGWHIAPTYEDCINYLKYFKNTDKKRIVKCKAKNIWKKEHSRGNIFLAEYIKIEKVV